MGKKILIVEDDSIIAIGLEYALEQEGFKVAVCRNVAESFVFLQENEVDMALLDVSLPDGNDYDICQFIKGKRDIPVIFLTVNDDEANVVMGLDLGADDYVAVSGATGTLPWGSILACIIGVFVIVFMTMRYAMAEVNKANIIDVLKTETV